MQLTLKKNKKFLKNYNILQRYQNDLKKYYSIVKTFKKYKDKIGEENLNFLAKVLHPLKDLLLLKEALEWDLKFYAWVLAKYPLTKERRLEFEIKKNSIKKELVAIGRLLTTLKEKWSK
jgi:hypothetical protein